MTRLLYLPDDATIIHLEVESTPEELVAAINSGMRPLPVLRIAPTGTLTAFQLGGTVVVTPGFKHVLPKKLEKNTEPTRRQKQILELSSRGFSTIEIAEMANISRRTVNYHLARIKNRIRPKDATARDDQNMNTGE